MVPIATSEGVVPTQAHIKWQSILGEFEFTKEEVVFKGRSVTDPETEKQRPTHGLAICNGDFGGGSISVQCSYDEVDYVPAVQIVVYRDPMKDLRLTAGLGGSNGIGTFVVMAYGGNAQGWKALAQAGYSDLLPNHEYFLEVRQQGSVLDLLVDEVHVLYLISRMQ